MTFKGSMVVAVGLGSLVVFACGDGDEPSVDGESVADGGEQSKPDQKHGGAEAQAGEGGQGQAELPARPLPSPEEIAAEIESIAGTSFVVVSDDESGRWGCKDHRAGVPAFMEATLSFTKNEDGALELISSVPDPWLRVSRSVLHRSADGWVAADAVPLGGCMAYVFEEEVADVWATPDALHLYFSGADSRGQPTSITVNAHFPETGSGYYSRDALVLVGKGKRDTTAPRLWHAPEYEHWDLDFGGKSKDWMPVVEEPFTARVFQFSELLGPGWTVAIEDPSGKRWPIAEGSPSAETTAITLDRYFPPGSRWVVDGRDLAGNVLVAEGGVPSAELSQLDGAFEADAQVWEFESWYAYDRLDLTTCDFGVRTCRATSLPGHSGVPAIEGTSSALLRTTRTLMRVGRADAATHLRFRVRAIAEHLAWQSLTVELMSLDTGASLDRTTHTFENWLPDAAIVEDSAEKVSELRDIEVPLPAGEGDILVVLDSPNPLWLDALGTE
jgi:hypothetical protein